MKSFWMGCTQSFCVLVMLLLGSVPGRASCLAQLYAKGITDTIGLNPEGRIGKAISRFAEKTETAKFLQAAYEEAKGRALQGEDFVSALARASKVDVVSSTHNVKVPKTGSLILIGNHPFGLPEGIAAYEFLERNRPGEVLGMATTSLATFMPEFAEHMALVNIDSISAKDPKYKEKKTAQTLHNAQAARKALRWLESGKVLCLFPAGATSRRIRIKDAEAVDRPWKNGAAFFMRATQSPVMFMHSEGSNSRISDFLSWLGEDIPLLARPWETRVRSENSFSVRVSDPLPYENIPDDLSDLSRTSYVYEAFLSFASSEDFP